MTDEEIAQIVQRLRIQGTDDGRVEAKSSVHDLPKSVWESVSAFANTNGGLIILGLSEENGFEPALGFEAQKIVDAVEAGLGTSDGQASKVKPVPRFDLDLRIVDGAPVVILTVHRLEVGSDLSGPCFVASKGMQAGSYKRVVDKDKRLSPYEIYALKSRWDREAIDDQPVPGMTSESFDEAIVEATFDRISRTGSRALDGAPGQLSRLQRINAVSLDGDATLAGFLTFGLYPQQKFPQLTVDVTMHPTVEKGGSATVRFLDRMVCDGPVPHVVSDAVQRVLANLRTVHVVDGTTAADVHEIPEEVLREAITNAVMHRDYSAYVRGQQVAVDVFPDRVEVTNPGGLWGDRTQDNIGDGRSTSRNPILSNLLRITPRSRGRGPIAENQGSGIPRMRDEMSKSGLPLPIYSVSLDSVTVTLHRHGLVTPEIVDWLRELPGPDRRREENLVLVLARQPKGATVAGIRQAIGLDSDRARDILGQLLADGFIEGLGDGPYTIAERPHPRAAEYKELTPSEQQLVAVLDPLEPRSIQRLVQTTGKPATALRPILRRLIADGIVQATAPPTSRKRAYILASAVD